MKRVELKLYHKDKYNTLRCLVGNCGDHLDLLSHQMLCKKELGKAGVETSKQPVFGIVQGNIVDDKLKKRYKVRHYTEVN